MDEREIAIKEAKACAASDSYFEARPQLKFDSYQRVFEAGFARGWDAARPTHPNGLSDEQIDAIGAAMEGGVSGFLTAWGWQQFARAIETAHGLGTNK